MIDAYLDMLDRALRRQGVSAGRRRRVLAEAADHMRCDPEALEAFGDPELVAEQVAAVERPRRARLLTLMLVGAMVAFVGPLYAIPENTLPPAPAEGLPATVTWKIEWAVVLYGAALLLALVAFALSWFGPRLVRWPAWLSVGALCSSAVFAGTAAVQWPVGGAVAAASVVPFAAGLVCLAAYMTARLRLTVRA